MKRLFSFTALFLCILSSFAQYSGSGSGTEDDPYLIFNETQLSQMSNFVNQEGVVFRLMKDLDLANWIAENSPSQGWQPIGVSDSPFKGKLLGNNKTLSGIIINRPLTDYVGFFGVLEGATISDLTLNGDYVKGKDNVGILAGRSENSTINNLSVNMSDGVDGEINVGGLIGSVVSNTIQNFNVNSEVSGTQVVGGAFGVVENDIISDGILTSTVTASEGNVAGVIGYAYGVNLTNIKTTCDVTANGSTGRSAGVLATGKNTIAFNNVSHDGDVQGQTIVSGFAGYLEVGASATFESCTSKGRLTNSGDFTGGIIAKCHSIEGMDNCSHFGDINGTYYVGGIIGASISSEAPTLHVWTMRNKSGTIIYDTKSDVFTNTTTRASSIQNCASIGNVTGSRWIGGIIGIDMSEYEYTEEIRIYRSGHYAYRYKDGVIDKNTQGYEILYSDWQRATHTLNFSDNYFSGDITGTEYVGGLAGQKGGGQFTNSYAYGNIYGTKNVGGVLGNATTTVTERYTTLSGNVAICPVVSASESNVGRVYGSVDDMNYLTIPAVGTTTSNRGLTLSKVVLSGVTQDLEENLQNGSNLGPSLLKLKATYVAMGWDFDNNWNIQETECYPYKVYQAAPPFIESDLVSQVTSISGKSVDGGTVYLYYKDNEPVARKTSNHEWAFNTEPLQSGSQVRLYAEVDGLCPSYFSTERVKFPGKGTAKEPYLIYTAEDLQGIYDKGYYRLMQNIDLTNWIGENNPTNGWNPIGKDGDGIHFDGDGHTISGLWMNSSTKFSGLFYNFSSGSIKNLNVEMANGKNVSGGQYTGALIGRMDNGEIANCKVTGVVEGINATQYVGGVSGFTYNTKLDSLTFEGAVNAANGDACVGGIIGNADNSATANCDVKATVSTSGESSYVGGLAGQHENSTITRCKADVDISATGASNNVGGLVGNLKSSLNQSFSTGSVKVTGDNSNTGGLVGNADNVTISDCYSNASTEGTLYTAGLVGYSVNSPISNAFATGDIKGINFGAGVVGELESSNATLTNSVALNHILALTDQSSWGCRVIGGYKNGAPDPDESNYALSTMQVSLNNVPQTKTDDLVEGIAKTEEELKTQSTYTGLGWDFTTVWYMNGNTGYPDFMWNKERTEQSISLSEIPAMTYGDDVYALPLKTDQGQLISWSSSDNTIALISDNKITIKGAGLVRITAYQAGSDVYNALTQKYDLTIAKAPLIISADNQVKMLGENVPELTVSYNGFVYNEDETSLTALPTVTTTATAESGEGSYPITVTGAESPNYEITFVNGTMTVVDETMLSHTLQSADITARSGSKVVLPINMTNSAVIKGIQFDLRLPSGVTVAKDNDDELLLELTERAHKSHMVSSSQLANGDYRIIITSLQAKTFSGTEGAVLNVTLDIPSDMQAGDYEVKTTNSVFTTDANVRITPVTATSVLTINDVLLGDVNADGFVDVTDVGMTIDHILVLNPAGFISAAADLNMDGVIDVTDVGMIIDMILSGDYASKQRENYNWVDMLDPQ